MTHKHDENNNTHERVDFHVYELERERAYGVSYPAKRVGA